MSIIRWHSSKVIPFATFFVYKTKADKEKLNTIETLLEKIRCQIIWILLMNDYD